MNKHSFLILAMLLCIFSSCISRSVTKPLAGAPGLETFTVPSEDGKTLLTSVKQLKT